MRAGSQRPGAEGDLPFISDWQGWDPNAISGWGGCIVSAQDAPDRAGSVLFARPPSDLDTLLILRADLPHFEQILATLRFPMPGPPGSSGNYDSPACREVPPVPAVSTRQAAGFRITESAIAVEACHPIEQFDGFRARFDALGLNPNALWNESQRQTAQAANQKLALFGLRLEERQTPHSWLSFDLLKGDEILVSNLVRLGEVSLRADGVDFLFWAVAEEEQGSQFPVLVYKNGLDTFSVCGAGVSQRLGRQPVDFVPLLWKLNSFRWARPPARKCLRMVSRWMNSPFRKWAGGFARARPVELGRALGDGNPLRPVCGWPARQSCLGIR